MYTALLVTAILLSLGIIALVLLQHGRGADTGAAFGGGASGSLFGSRGSATFLSRVTSVVVALFFVNCLALAWIVKGTPTEASIVEQLEDSGAVGTESAPAQNLQPDPVSEIPE